MFIYFIILAFIAICAYNYDLKGYEHNKNKIQWILIVILIALSGLRNKIGSDTIGYEYNFNLYPDVFTMIKNKTFLESSQPLWVLYNGLIKTLFGNFVFFQLIHAAIVNLLIFNFIRKTTPFVFSVYLVFCIVSWWDLNFEILRESMCVALFLNALLMLIDKKWKYYIVMAAIASLIHSFAIVMFIIVPIIIYVPKKILYTCFPILLLYLLFVINHSDIMSIILTFGDYLSVDKNDRIMAYMDDVESFTTQNTNGMIQIVLCGVISPVLLILKSEPDKRNFLFNKLLLLYLILYILQGQLVILHRFLNYLYLVPIIYSIKLLLSTNNKGRVNKYIVGIAMLLLVYVKALSFYHAPAFQSSWYYDYRYIPYKSIFQEPNKETINEFPYGTVGIIE